MANNSEFMLRSEGGFFTDELKLTFFIARVCPKHSVCGKEFESNYTIVYIKEGCFDVLSNDKTATLEEGDLFLSKPYEKYALIPARENEKMSFLTINIHPSLLEICDKENKIFRAFDGKNTNELCIYRKEELKEAQMLIDKAYRFQKLSLSLHAYKSLVTLLLFEICEIYDKTHQFIPAKFSHEYDLKIYSYIQSRALTKIKIEDVTNEFFISDWYVNKVCRKFYNNSFGELLKITRMWAARGFMASKKTNDLHKIAELCGYNDYSAFYRIYKKFFGISPKDDLKYFKEHKEFYRK